MSDGEAESDLLRAAQDGDRASLSRLLLRHYDDLQRHLASRITGDLQALLRAEDVLHQTLVRAASALTDFQPRQAGSFRAWLKTIAENLIRDAEKRRRRERRAVRRERPTGASESASWQELADQLAGDSTSPSGQVQRGENVRCLRVALACLPAEQREIIERYYLQEESFEQIAQVLGRTPDAIRGSCYRARKNLRALLGRSSWYFSG